MGRQKGKWGMERNNQAEGEGCGKQTGSAAESRDLKKKWAGQTI